MDVSHYDRVVLCAILGPERLPTGKVCHFIRGAEAEPARELRIIQLDGDPGFYLIRFNVSGVEITDTYHDTVEMAMEQAEFEFGLMPGDWKLP